MSNNEHAQWCRMKVFGNHEDAAKRIADTYSLHRIAADTLGLTNIGKFFAAALADGTTDGVLYDTKQDAVSHQKHNEQFYTFIKIGPWHMTACDAAVMLKVSRSAYDKGLRLADPQSRSGGRELIKRATIEDMRSLASGKASNLILPFPL